jgi:lipopolysaccharide transport system ATP-binding protein
MTFALYRDNLQWPYPNFHIFDSSGKHLCVVSNRDYPVDRHECFPGIYTATCEIPANFLNAGHFSIGAVLTFMDTGVSICFSESNAITFQTTENFDLTLNARRYGYSGPIPGPIWPEFNWRIEFLQNAEGAAK